METTDTKRNTDIQSRWKGDGFGDYRCVLCDETISGQKEICPNCGAAMDCNPDILNSTKEEYLIF